MMESQYGLTFDAVNKVYHLKMQIESWGSWADCTMCSEYELTQLRFNKGAVFPMTLGMQRLGAYYLESGSVIVCHRSQNGQQLQHKLELGSVFHFVPGQAYSFYALESSILYRFSNRVSTTDNRFLETVPDARLCFEQLDADDVPPAIDKTFDRRDKYWGTIETVLNGDVAGKIISLRAGYQSSLEYHCRKVESYVIHSGRVKVGLRVGRAENRSVVLGSGDCFDVRPGLMHMRMGLEDSVIIEISTADSDSDSYLVEDGRTYRYVETEAHLS